MTGVSGRPIAGGTALVLLVARQLAEADRAGPGERERVGIGPPMKLIERYIFGRAAGAFLLTLIALAGVVWMTQALRQMNLITAKGQTLLVFLEITLLAVPFLLIVIAPFAMVIAAIYTLSALNAESELVVLSASGASRFVPMRPLVVLSGTVAIVMLMMTTVAAPLALRQLRVELTRVNVDLIANIVRPGRFTEIEDGLTFHIRNRAADGSMAGLFIEDRRDKDIAFTYIADRANIVEMVGKTLLVMRDGAIHRLTNRDGALSIVKFEAYAFDLTGMTPQNTQPIYRPSERFTGELLAPDIADDYTARNLGRFRSELNERFSQPLLPIAFTVIAFMALGEPRTTRQGRGMAVFSAVLGASALRGIHFAASSASVNSIAAAAFMYIAPLAVIVGGLALAASDRGFALPRPVERAIDNAADGVGAVLGAIGRRFGLAGDEQGNGGSGR